ncbi:7364_t:CDS:2 [Ambispora gerdemannii]|uniref:7364_t:CDS:1 n=1 Tax=Ambispora gerdemannii TaxID=144530 RepID=A0A9N9FQF2_9GLOM|nr:7364_t:CDS:2 [Ambispora gerdemannii]
MTERTNNRICSTFQNPGNSYPGHGQVGVSTSFSPDLHKHILGCHSPTMGIPYQKKENGTDLSGRDALTLGGEDEDNGTGSRSIPKDNKPHAFNSEEKEKMLKKKSKTKRNEKKNMQKEDKPLHVWGVRPQSNSATKQDVNQKQQGVIRIESPNDTDVEMPSNIITEDGVQVPVHKVSEDSREDEPHRRCKNSLMVVEKIKNKSDACRVAKSVWYTLINEESGVDDGYLKSIKNIYWDAMVALLRPLGKNLDECDLTRLVWHVEPDTTITEFYYFE